MERVRVAIIGQGRSGRDIHGSYFKRPSNKHFDVAYIVECDDFRRQRAGEEFPGCVTLSDYTELFGKTDVDLVVNASYSQMHYPISLDLIQHGFNVLVEKPFGANYFECANLTKQAKKNNVTLAVFQQSNKAPFYVFTKQLMDSGRLGDIKQISIRYNGFSRRWDWQTLQCKLAGSVYNTGPHPLGVAMGLVDFDENLKVVYSKLDTALTSGDAEDYAKIILEAPGKPVIDIEINSTDAYANYNIKLQGSKGTYKCTTMAYEMKYIVDGENVERPVIFESLSGENKEPIYCSEQLVTHEESGKFDGDAFCPGTDLFYDNLYDVLNGKDELYFDPYQIARLIGFIDAVHANNPLPVKY